MFIRRGQRGDTIVEVLISIAVVSMVLAGAYVTTQRSLIATRAAQERSNALKLGQGQLEQLKGIISSNPNSIFGPGAPTPFCISGGTVVAATNAGCRVNTNGAATSVEPIFRLSIARAGNNFTLTETWTNVGGKQTDSLQLRYRAYR